MNQLPPPLTMELLAQFVRGKLSPEQAGMVMQMALTDPVVAQVVDVLSRQYTDEVIHFAVHADAQQFIESGKLEEYLQGVASPETIAEVELMVALHPEVARALAALEAVHHRLVSSANAIQAPARSRDRFLNFMELEADSHLGEERDVRPPYLNAGSKSQDYAPWTEREGIRPPEQFDNVFVMPVHADQDCRTLLVWVKKEIAGEVHLSEVEKFLVLEGTCMIDVEGTHFNLQAGDYMSIPKYRNHTVYVTSDYPCKLIVQQIAA